MTNAINAIQFAYTQYESEQIKKEDVKEKSPKKEVIYSQVKDFSSVEGNFSNQRIIQQGKSVFDMIRDSFFTQRGINVSYVSSVSGVSSTTEKIKSVASEMVSLQQELTTLVSEAIKLTDLSDSDKEIKSYQKKYVELYNKLVDKKAEFDRYVNLSNLTEAQVKELCKEANDKYGSNEKSVIDKYTDIDSKRQINAYQVASLAGADVDDSEMQQLQAQDQVYELEQNSLEQQYAIASLDLFSTDTKLEKMSTGVQQKTLGDKVYTAARNLNKVLIKSDLEYKYLTISNKKQIIAYQIAALSGDNDFKKELEELKEADATYEKEQKIIETQLKEINSTVDLTSLKLDDTSKRKLFMPQKQELKLQINNLIFKITDIENKIKENEASLKTTKDEREKEQLVAINDVYELEKLSLKTQYEMVYERYKYVK